MRDFVIGSYLAGTAILSGVARRLCPDKRGFEAALERLSRGLKTYGRKLPWLCEVRDGSKSTRHKKVIAQGWWTVVVATDPAHRVLPLLRHLYSTVHPAYKHRPR